jgi:hypothetical protein
VRTWAVVGGAFLILITLWDAFETIILTRRVSRWTPPAGAPDNWQTMA